VIVVCRPPHAARGCAQHPAWQWRADVAPRGRQFQR